MKTSISQKIIKALVATLAIGVIASACGSSSSSRQRNATVATCAQGGTCVIGDAGPGGGIVFFVSQTLINQVEGVSNGGYLLEVAPMPLGRTPWCGWTGKYPPRLNTLENIGFGAQNSRDITKYCPNSAAKAALDLNLGGVEDWFLPSRREADAFGLQWPQGSSDKFWSSSQLYEERSWSFGGAATPQCCWHYQSPVVENRWFAIRAFGTVEQSIPPTTTTSSTTSTTLPATTTTSSTIPDSAIDPVLTCATGGTCVVGDTGPAGGKVFFVSPTPINAAPGVSDGGTYLEYATTQDTPIADWCDQVRDVPATQTGVGSGAGNTAAIIATCTSGAAKLAADTRITAPVTFRDYTDWFVPSKDELDLIFRFAGSGSTAWSSSQSDSGSAWYGYSVNGDVGSAPKPKQSGGANKLPARLVRAFSATPAYVAPPVTNCATGGKCAVGDTGPSGGVVFYISPTPLNAVDGVSTGGVYLEAAPQGWSKASTTDPSIVFGCVGITPTTTNEEIGFGAAATKAAATCTDSGAAAKRVLDLKFARADDWFLPSTKELVEMLKVGNSKIAYSADYYMTANQKDANTAVFIKAGPADSSTLADSKSNARLVRPIRAFSPRLVSVSVPAEISDSENIVFNITNAQGIDCTSLSKDPGVDFVVTGITSIASITATGTTTCAVNAVANARPDGVSVEATIKAAATFAVKDAAGNTLTILDGGQKSITVTRRDTIPPLVTLAAPATATASALTFTVTGNEALDCATLSKVAGVDFDLSKITSINSITQSSPKVCTIAASSDAVEALDTAASRLTAVATFSISDSAGNAQTTLQGSPQTVNVSIPDLVVPVVTLGSLETLSTSLELSYTVVASKAVNCTTLSTRSGVDFTFTNISSIKSITQTSASVCTIIAISNAAVGEAVDSSLGRASTFSIADASNNVQTNLPGAPAVVKVRNLSCAQGGVCAVGDVGPSGGIVFLTPTTTGNTTGKYFEAAPATWANSVSDPSVAFGCRGTLIGSAGTAVGSGVENQTRICNTTGTAAQLVRGVAIAGKSDWFIPAKDELAVMMAVPKIVSSMSTGLYWSSSEKSTNDVWAAPTTAAGVTQNYVKVISLYVRPVRMFSVDVAAK